MHLQIRYPGESKAVLAAVQAVASKPAEVRLVKGAIVAPYEESLAKLALPDVDLAGSIKLVVEESGGAGCNTGHAQIVCRHDGGKFVPFAEGHSCNAPHARFSIRDVLSPIVLVRASWWNKGLPPMTISLVEVQFGRLTWIVERVLWSGAPEELPGLYARFAPAMEAAARKARAYHCRGAYWVEPAKARVQP